MNARTAEVEMGRLLTLAGLIAVLAGCGKDSSGPVAPMPATVSMPGFSFTPFTTTINAGATVTFEFPAEPHNVIFAKVAGAPADIQQTINRSVSRTFAVAGSFAYDCLIHPGMSGVVLVR